MFKIWIFLAIIAISGSRVSSYDDDGDDRWFDEYWYEDLVDNSYDADVKEPANSTPSASIEETKTSPAAIAEEHIVPNKNDYLFEDVRSELDNSNEDFRVDDIKDDSNYAGKFDSNSTLVPLTDGIENDKKKLEDTAESTAFKNENYDDIAYYSNESEKKILEETKNILDEDTGNDFEQFKSDENIEKTDTEIIEDTSKILLDTSDLLGEIDEEENKGIEKMDESVSLEHAIKELPETAEEDTVSKAVGDLMTDIDNLHKTWDKLRGFDDNNRESSEVGEDGSYDYEEIDDDNLNKIFDTISKKQVTENLNGENEVENVNKMTTKEASQEAEEINNTSEPILYLNDALMASETENTNSATTLKVDNVSDTVLFASANTTVDSEEASPPEAKTTEEADYSKSSELSSAEAEQLMKDFATEHKELMQISSADVRNAINIRLTVDKPVVITSPDFPRPYPTGNTVDWMITGDGMGIELNITDFHVNGFRGDYVLIKPGGIDVSGSTGLLVTYELKTERRYRFLDVDQMFIRFHSATGMSFMRGFSMSMRMVVPRPGAIIEDVTPEPEPVIPIPPATITLNLGGVSLERFIQIEEEFRKIIADMATIYINTHDIDPGLNSTIETTQILSRALCFHNWPKFELCTEVKFGVPIVYEEDEDVVETRPARLNETDLMDMWETMSQRDPFGVRLRILGITEYQVPNDHGILIIWFVLAGGVVISMAMLAFALWRFSCFAGYTRMPPFSDSDSIKEKQNLDLYPTPHQTLPPLYFENDYKWADAPFDSSATVDMSGYANKSYMQNDFFEIESEEEVMPTRDRSSGFSPRDIYSV